MKKMFFSVLMMLFVAFAYAEGTPASTKLPVEKISVKKFSETQKDKQIPSNASTKEVKVTQVAVDLCIYDVTYNYIGPDGNHYVGGYSIVAPCPGAGYWVCLPAGYYTICL
jgi:hypothetical protein